jgi:hypothetical protein
LYPCRIKGKKDTYPEEKLDPRNGKLYMNGLMNQEYGLVEMIHCGDQ